MEDFYITFGSEDHIFKGGWIVVKATSKKEALEKLIKKYEPEMNPEKPWSNVASIYTEKEFKRTNMSRYGNFDVFEIGRIG